MPFSPSQLRRIRTQAGLNRETLGLAVGRGYHAVRTWETGTTVPPLHVVERIAAALEVPMTALLEESRDA